MTMDALDLFHGRDGLQTNRTIDHEIIAYWSVLSHYMLARWAQMRQGFYINYFLLGDIKRYAC